MIKWLVPNGTAIGTVPLLANSLDCELRFCVSGENITIGKDANGNYVDIPSQPIGFSLSDPILVRNLYPLYNREWNLPLPPSTDEWVSLSQAYVRDMVQSTFGERVNNIHASTFPLGSKMQFNFSTISNVFLKDSHPLPTEQPNTSGRYLNKEVYLDLTPAFPPKENVNFVFIANILPSGLYTREMPGGVYTFRAYIFNHLGGHGMALTDDKIHFSTDKNLVFGSELQHNLGIVHQESLFRGYIPFNVLATYQRKIDEFSVNSFRDFQNNLAGIYNILLQIDGRSRLYTFLRENTK